MPEEPQLNGRIASIINKLTNSAGQQHVLERVNLDYQLPLELAPTGCIRWPGE